MRLKKIVNAQINKLYLKKPPMMKMRRKPLECFNTLRMIIRIDILIRIRLTTMRQLINHIIVHQTATRTK